jgi:hypothetical protein
MTPFSFEWLWNVEYGIFFGLLYIALGIVFCGLNFVLVKTVLQVFGFMRERHFDDH